MGVVQLQLPDDVQRAIDRAIAAGDFVDQADFLATAVRTYAEHLESGAGLVEIAEAGLADMAAGRYRTIASHEDAEALNQRTMARLAAKLGSDHRGG
jgi:Arc/MetJ-type ribon-helix-helix transcriptional regulator